MATKLMRLLVAFAFVPTVVFGFGFAGLMSDHFASQADQRLQVWSAEAAQRVDRFVDARLNFARMIPQVPVLRNGAIHPDRIDGSNVLKALRETALDDRVNTISCAIIDVEGHVLVSTSAGEPDEEVVDREQLQRTVREGHPRQWAHHLEDTDEIYSVVVAGPIRDDDEKIVALIRWKLQPAVLDQALGLIPHPGPRFARVLIDDHGRSLATVGDVPPTRTTEWLGATSATPGWIELGQEDYRVVRTATRYSPWSVITLQPESEWHAQADRLWWVVIGVLGLSGLLIVLVGLRVASTFSDPVVELTNSIADVSLDTETKLPRLKNGTRELEQLHDGFVQMLDRVHDAHHRRQVMLANLEQAQETLRYRELYYRQLFDSSPDAMAVIRDRQIVDVNALYCELFGDTKELPFEDSSSPLIEGQLRRAEDGDGVDFPLELVALEGRRFAANVRMGRIQTESGPVVVLIVRDVSRQRELEEQLRQSHKMDAVGQLAGGVAHDFNNMLGVIIPSVDLLEQGLDDAKTAEAVLSSIRMAAERAAELTNKLLAFSRKGKVVTTVLDVNSTVNNVVTLLSRSVDRRIRLDVDLTATRTCTLGDPNQLESALLNLGINARDAMPQGGHLVFRTRDIEFEDATIIANHFSLGAGHYLLLEVEDSGCGIPDEQLSRIYEPFFTTKAPGQGTGLGLAAVFGAVQDHGGAIEVVSEVEVGSTFRIYLPVTEPIANPHRTLSEAPLQGSGRVLVVDDEHGVRSTAALLLTSLGYEVETANDGNEAVVLYRADSQRYDVVLMDQVMPGMPGLEAARIIRQFDPNAVIVLCSGYPRQAEVSDALNSILSGFLQKPYSRAGLAMAIGDAVRQDRVRLRH